jgi:hypothetical protein
VQDVEKALERIVKGDYLHGVKAQEEAESES